MHISWARESLMGPDNGPEHNLKTTDQAQSMYIGNLNKQIWALLTYIGPGPKVLSSDRPTIYNHAPPPPSKSVRNSDSYRFCIVNR